MGRETDQARSLGGGPSSKDLGEVWVLPLGPSYWSDRHVAKTSQLQLVEGSQFPG